MKISQKERPTVLETLTKGVLSPHKVYFKDEYIGYFISVKHDKYKTVIESVDFRTDKTSNLEFAEGELKLIAYDEKMFRYSSYSGILETRNVEEIKTEGGAHKIVN